MLDRCDDFDGLWRSHLDVAVEILQCERHCHPDLLALHDCGDDHDDDHLDHFDDVTYFHLFFFSLNENSRNEKQVLTFSPAAPFLPA